MEHTAGRRCGKVEGKGRMFPISSPQSQSASTEHAAAAELLEQFQTRHQVDQRDGEALLRGKAERIGIVQPGAEQALG